MKPSLLLVAVALLLAIIPGFGYAVGPILSSSFSINQQSSNSIDIRFEIPTWRIEETQRDGIVTKQVKIDEAPYLFIEDEETLPILTTSIAIPYSGGVDFRVVDSQMRFENSFTLSTHNTVSRYLNNRFDGNSLYPENRVVVSEPTIIRDMRIVTINVYPFQYNKNTRQLIVNESIDIRLSFNNLPSVNEMNAPTQYSSSFERIYRSLILNYDSFVQGRMTPTQDPVILIIHANYTDAVFVAKLNELIELKKQRGYKVYSASTAVTGTSSTAIKTYIQNAYDTWTDRPDYIILVGDVSGTIGVATHYYSSAEGDYPYTHLAGNDLLGDVFIGRISVSSSTEMSTYVSKVLTIEKNINVNSADWLNRMLLVGDTATSGISTIYINQYIHEVSEAVNPAYTYTELYQNSPSATTMNSVLSQGVSIFNFRGYLGMSGWVSSSVDNLYNGNKLFNAVIITCGTGSFASSSKTEDIIRAGTPASPKGAITAIGMATVQTHTSLNNCLNVGIFHGLYPAEMRNMGEPLLLAKLYLHSVYGVSHAERSVFFAQICNLMGDPTVPVYVGIPDTFEVEYPSSIVTGTGSIEVIVRNSAHELVSNGIVTLTNSSGLQVISRTNANGIAVLTIPTNITSPLTLMVSKDDFKPSVLEISINSTGGLVYDGCVIDDDNNGNSSGNNNQIVNAGETIEFKFYLKNTSGSHITSASGELFCNDPYITVNAARLSFSNIAPGASVLNNTAARFTVSPNCPDNYLVSFTARGGGTIQNWFVNIPVIVRAGALVISEYSYVGSDANIIYPGETKNLTLALENMSSTPVNNVYAELVSEDILMVSSSAPYYYGNISGESVVSNAIPFEIIVRPMAVVGMVIPMSVNLYNNSGYSQSLPFSITIGESSVTDPLGQDLYGYFIFDEGDTGYPQCPVYDWVGIAPSEGGLGTILNLTDPGATNNEGDQVGAASLQTVDLPFPFTFYGRSYNQITISSNGFIAMGVTNNSDWRNGRLPGPGGANPMIAVFWDDLQLNTGSGVYTYYDAVQHYYVVEWYNVISGYDRITPETFQAILYSPEYYPTQTGDGQIKLQYKLFNNIDLGSGAGYPHGNFATIGIKDHNGAVGLEYTYANQYPTAAKPLTHESALFITTKPFISQNASLYMDRLVIYDQNGNELIEPGETVNLAMKLNNLGLTDATNVQATISSSDPYITVLSHSSGFPSIEGLGTAYSNQYYTIVVAENCPNHYTASLNVAITSTSGTWSSVHQVFVQKATVVLSSWTIVDVLGNGNYVLDPGESGELILNLYNESNVAAQNVQVALAENSPYIALSTTSVLVDEIPVHKKYQKRVGISVLPSTPIGTEVLLNLTITSSNGEPSTSQVRLFIGEVSYLYDFETTNGGFTATTNQSIGWEWGTSTYAGAYSGTKVWGTGLNINYDNLAVYELVSPSMQVSSTSLLTFRHRFNIENNYDGGQVLISTDNGANWTIIHPDGGYPHNSLPALGGPGYHGTLNQWTLATFTLSSYANQQVRFKWLFKTDGTVVREGWFIDDVEISSATASAATGSVIGSLLIDGQVSSNQNVFVSVGNYTRKVAMDGSFRFDLPTGHYTLSALLDGHKSSEQIVDVQVGGSITNANPHLQYLPVPANVTWIVEQNDLRIKWDPVLDPQMSSYRIYEKKGTQPWAILQDTDEVSIMLPASYDGWSEYIVVARYDDSESSYERTIVIDYNNHGDDLQPQKPNQILITKNSNTYTINWQEVTNDTNGDPMVIWEYRVFASDTPDFDMVPATFLGSTTQPTYNDNYDGTRRFYKIVAVVGFVN